MSGDKATKSVRFTAEEINTIIHALQIAAEDGSIYPTAIDETEDAAGAKHVNAVIESIERKLKDAR